jgi:hypothetical protein
MAFQYQALLLIGPICELRRKGSVVNMVPGNFPPILTFVGKACDLHTNLWKS